MSGRGGRTASRLFRLAIVAFPRRFARAHAEEIAAAFERELARVRAQRGRAAGALYASRAIWDAVWQGARERTRRGPARGHGARRPSRGGRLGSGVRGDLRHAVRRLGRSPGFTLTAVAVLALGIGANTTVFSALRVVILSPPPYPEPERLVLADLTQEHVARGETRMTRWSYPKFERLLEAEGRLIDPVAGYVDRVGTLSGGGPATRISLEVVSSPYFELLGVSPLLGRSFTSDEDDPTRPSLVVILSHELWRGRYGGDPAVVGRDVTINGATLRVVGVAPEGFRGLTGVARLWVPIAAVDQALGYERWSSEAGNHWFHVLGRLRPDATHEDARAQMAGIGAGVAESYPSSDPQTVWSATARPLLDVRKNPAARSAVLLLSAGALLVLLAACANLSGLLLARSKRMAKDAAVRMAVGASRWRIVRAALIESVMLAMAGGTAGVGLALLGTRAMRAAWPESFLSSGRGELRIVDPTRLAVDPAVLAFAAGITLLTALVFGTAPALRASATRVSGALNDAVGVASGGRIRGGLDGRSALVGAQVALALVLLVGAGLVGRSVGRLMQVDLGFQAERLLTFRYAIPSTSAWSDRPEQLHDELMARLTALPLVESAGAGTQPLGGRWGTTRLDAIEGGQPIPPDAGISIGVHAVSDRYFETLGVPLLRGRTFDQRDGTDRFPTTVISASAARALFGDEDPIGRRIDVGFADPAKESFAQIVGVVGDVMYVPPDQPRLPETYFSHREFGAPSTTVLVRTSPDPSAAVASIRSLAAEVDATLAIFGVATLDDVVKASVGDRRVVLGLLGLFALVSVLLAATGTWGIVAVSVAERRRELGLRMALGAADARVLRLVLGRSLRAALFGVTLGIAGGAAASRLVEVFLWQTTSTDPAVFAAGSVTLVGVVLLASWIPARRALRVDPAEALRSE